MKINGVELEFNYLEEQTNKRTEKALKHVADTAGESDSRKKNHEKISAMCSGVKEAFDLIFGMGTGDNVCGEENNLLKCSNAFTELLNEKRSQELEMLQSAKRLASVLKPEKE